MKRFRTLGIFSAITLVLSCIFLTAATAQVKFRSEDLVVKVKGTSSLHDWEIKSNKGKVEGVLVLGPNYKITGVSGLRFTVVSETLKSGHNMMDNNTYKALKTNTHENISFVLTSANITQIDASTYQLKGIGNMTIAGTTRETDLVAVCKVNSDGTFTWSGSKDIKMTDFNIKPPTAIMGTVKTGNDISIAYNLKIGK